ncbi:MAG: 23S rRNA (adenine(2503)-C(2))-methyltransferase RlmN [Candidatus Auribacterota bacterium]|jgi:23S rRNA (adenine2503-C2)-methyltransferase|nr:23S rRNA (adenine(2503)-C(2))-methyltransferase RlmN [Candidatus Auribacterota bacterium]
MNVRHSISELSFDELHTKLEQWGHSRYRAGQLIGWLYKHNAVSFDLMSNLPKQLIAQLSEEYDCCSLSVVKTITSGEGTVKYLFQTVDGQYIEGVSMPDGDLRHTVCISTQIGCPWGCLFCASGKHGFVRNLSVGEIVDQVRIMSSNQPISNIVIMGGGEPLMNFKQLEAAYRIFTDDAAYAIGKRRVSVSTAGYVPGIEQLIRSDIRPQLAVSLHAPTDDKRSQVLPINRKYPINKLMETCKKYAQLSRRPVSFEYIVIPGFNNGDDDARALVKLLKKYPAKINLIPLNPVEGFSYRCPTEEEVYEFQSMLLSAGFVVTIRWSKGQDIGAACGQLRSAQSQSDL